jgi:hypothetical protein
MRLDEIDPTLAKTLHRAKSRTATQPAPVNQPPVNHQGQPILQAQNSTGSWPLPGIQTMQGVSADFPASTLT